MGNLDLLKKKAKPAEGMKLNFGANSNAVKDKKVVVADNPVATDNDDSGIDVNKPVGNSSPAVPPPVKQNPLKLALSGLAAPVPAETASVKPLSANSISEIGDLNMDAVVAVTPAPTGDAPNLANYIYEGQAETADARTTEAFYEQLKMLETSFGSAFCQGNITMILKYVDEHIFLKDILKPVDIGIMVKGLRESYGVAVQASTSRKKKKTVRAEEVNDVLDILSDINI